MKTSKVLRGLNQKPSYNELIDYIERDPDKIKMPDRRAKFMRNSFYLSQLDGEGERRYEEQAMKRKREAEKDLLIEHSLLKTLVSFIVILSSGCKGAL